MLEFSPRLPTATLTGSAVRWFRCIVNSSHAHFFNLYAVDGTLFKINKDTGAFTVVSLANMTQIPESYFGIVDYWQETVLRIDDINGNIYIAAKNADQYPEYPSLFVFDADLNLLSNVTYSGLFSLPVFGSIGTCIKLWSLY
jgi:hypothetical protein